MTFETAINPAYPETSKDIEDIEDIEAQLETLYGMFDGARSKQKDMSTFMEALPLIVKLPEEYRVQHIESLEKVLSPWGFSKPDIKEHIDIVEKSIRGLAKKNKVEDWATDLYNIAKDTVLHYVDTETNEHYIQFSGINNPGLELRPLDSLEVRDYLHSLGYREFNKVMRLSVLETVTAKLHGDPAVPVHLSLRVAELNGLFYYDIADARGHVVEISPNRWHVLSNDEIVIPLFRRNKIIKEQVCPADTTSLDFQDLVDLLRIPDKGQELLTAVWIVATFIPNLTIPILSFCGEKGSGKTLASRTLLWVTSPTTSDVLKQPKDEDRAENQLFHHHVLAYDNLYTLPPWFAHMLSCAVTGTSTQKRKFYNDIEPLSITFKRPIILNSVHSLGLAYTDLQDRIIVIRLERKMDTENIPEAVYKNKVEELLPGALGEIFTILSKALSIKPGITLEKMPRFADFAIWGCAIAEAMHDLGHWKYSREAFLTAYYENIDLVSYQVLEFHPVAVCVLALLSREQEWHGTPANLFNELNLLAPLLNVDRTVEAWPKGANWLVRRLNEIKSNLEAMGVSYYESRERIGVGKYVQTVHLSKRENPS